MKLTDEQQRIVAHGTGHAKISAVAGSGKTTTMVARILHLLDTGVMPQRVLVLMFNRSARDGFAAALQDSVVPADLPLPEIRTFHSLGLRLVDSFSRKNFLPHRTLITNECQFEKFAKNAVKQIFDQAGGVEEWLSSENMESFFSFIDMVKAGTLSAEKVFDCLQLPDRFSYFVEAFELFESQRLARRIRFYADLIHEPVMAMLANRQLEEWAANHIDHIIVDEYQDINEVQQHLLKIIAGDRAQVMVVGDVDQCIYEWRGAKPQFITTRFAMDFPHAVNYTLSSTFRYGHCLSLAANHLISHNRMRDRKQCLSFFSTPNTIVRCVAEKDPHPILGILEELAGEGRSPGEIAVLVRLFAMSVPLELVLLEAHIPYRLVGHEEVFSCTEIKALSGYLHLCRGSLAELDPNAAVDVIEAMLINPHLGVKREIIGQLAAEIACQPWRAAEILLSAIHSDMPPFLVKRFAQTSETWREIADLPVAAKAGQILETIISKTKLFDYYRNITDRFSTAENRIKTCQAFMSFAWRQDLVVAPFLEKMKNLQQRGKDTEKDCLLITSIHRAKGLEWPVVIIPGLEEGFFPLHPDEQSTSFVVPLEDERRLFYVAMTRARQKVYCIHPSDRRFEQMKKDGKGRYPQTAIADGFPASRFLYEANIGLSNRLGEAIEQRTAYSGTTITAQDVDVANDYLAAIDSSLPQVKPPVKQSNEKDVLTINDLAEGMLVRHQIFGSGVVTTVTDRRLGKVRVLFGEQGEKLLMAGIARLRPQ